MLSVEVHYLHLLCTFKNIYMAEKKVVTSNPNLVKEPTGKTPSNALPLFEKENYKWMIIGAVVIALGMLLMVGGKK